MHPPQEPASNTQELRTDPQEPASDTQEQEPERVYLGDSWFGSIKTAANFGKANQHAIMQVKTAHARFPKKFLKMLIKMGVTIQLLIRKSLMLLMRILPFSLNWVLKKQTVKGVGKMEVF